MGKGTRTKKTASPPAPAPARAPRSMPRVEAVLRTFFAVLLLVVILALYPYTRDATAPIKYLLIAWGAAIAATLLLVLGTLQDVPWRMPRVLPLILIAFIGVNLLAALASDYVPNAMVTWRRFASLFIVYAIAAEVYRKPRHISGLMLVACIGVGISTLYAVAQYFGLDPFPWESKESPLYRELPGTFGNPNYAAHTMILCIVMAVFLATRRRTRWAVAFAILFLVHMYFTGQRGGLVGLGMAVALLVVANAVRTRIHPPRRAVIVSLSITALIVPVIALIAMGVFKARTGIALPVERQLLLRYHGYDGAARMILANPLLGFGPGNYEIENPFFWTIEEQEWFAMVRKMNQHVHNDILEAGVDAGFPGAVLYLLFLVTGIGQGLMLAFTAGSPVRRRLGWALAALFCAFLVDGALGFNSRVPVSALLIFLAAGTLDGLHLNASTSPPVPARSRAALGIRLALCVSALVFAIYETRVFLAEKQLQLGRGAFLGNAFNTANGHFERAEELCPWQWLAPFERAKCALRIAQRLESEKHPEGGYAMRNKAAEHFRRSAERNPTYVLSLLGIAETNFSLGHAESEFNRDTRGKYLEDARSAAAEAEELCPLLPEAHDILGRIACLRAAEMRTAGENAEAGAQEIVEQWHIAIHHLRRALELGSENKSALHLMLAQAHAGTQELDAVEDDFREAIAAEPANRDILPALYRFGSQYNRYDFLRELLGQYLERLRATAPEETEITAKAALYLAAAEYGIFKDEEKAEKAYVTAAKAAPDLSDTWSAFAQFSKKSNRPKAFQTAVTQACHNAIKAGKKPLPQVEAVVAVWEGGSRKLPEATGELARALQNAVESGLAPQEARNQFGWPAEVLLVESQKQDIASTDRGIALLNIGTMLDKMDLLSLAGTVLQAAVRELPPPQAALAAREAARVLARQNKNEDAFEMLQKALALEPDNPETRLEFARTLAKLGRNTEARKEYAIILDMPGVGQDARETITKEMRALQ